VIGIVEDRASRWRPTEGAIERHEVAVSTYAFEGGGPGRALRGLARDNDQGEYYLTDVIRPPGSPQGGAGRAGGRPGGKCRASTPTGQLGGGDGRGEAALNAA